MTNHFLLILSLILLTSLSAEQELRKHHKNMYPMQCSSKGLPYSVVALLYHDNATVMKMLSCWLLLLLQLVLNCMFDDE